LILPFRFNIEIFDEFERLVGRGFRLHTLDRTLNEALNVKDGKYADLVKRLVDLKEIQVINSEADRPVDDALVEFADKKGFVVCTNDTELKERLDKKNLPFIYMRQENYLEAENLRI
ncbi:MAG: hypothetical protein SVV03_01905, partial [Candidatus Nanohaloarchaea archaeon]|nr:hypothetical protein [Candidatus Nanohaloarchaea archaeon]